MNSRWFVFLILLVAGEVTAGESCPEIDGIKPLLGPGNILLLGELHGTVESPQFTLDTACIAAKAGLSVIVGLELPPEGQDRVNAFLGSQGVDQDREALLAGSRWQSNYQDGRSSRAMLDLIDGLRRLRGDGLPVSVALFDAPAAGSGQERERDMASNLAAVTAGSPESMLIVLTGNYHSRTSRGSRRSATYEPMGYLLEKMVSPANLVALDVAHGGGSAWICSPDCGVSNLRGRHGNQQWTVEMDEATRPAGHKGWYHVGAISASPPAHLPLAEVPMQTAPITSATPPDSSELQAEPAAARSKVDGPLSAVESRLQGAWQAYEFGSEFKLWTIRFEGRNFRADVAEDDWYEGRVEIRDEQEPAQMDLAIDDCRCSYKGMASEAIYLWDGESLVLSAPQPGNRRPLRFEKSSGQMVRLLRQAD